MPSFGEKLKQEREKRNITLEQISLSTKIGTRMLQALEEDKFNQLPGGIFNKGFVRAYSRCVGLDEEQTVADYLQASGDVPPVSTEIVPSDDSAGEDSERVSRLEASNNNDVPPSQLPWGWFAALLLLIALALSFWNHRRQEHSREPVRPAPANSAPRSAADAGVGTTTVGTTDEPGNPASPPSAVPAVESAPSRSPAVSPAAESNPAAGEADSPASAAAPYELRVALHAREESWISATIDGQATSSEILSAGSDRHFRGHNEIIVKLGNAAGVDLRFNGKTIDLGGKSGEVKTLTFGPLGLLPNAQ